VQRAGRGILGLVIVLMLAACAPGAAPTATGNVAPAGAAAAASQSAAPAPAPPRTPIKLVQALPSRDFGFLPAFVAASKGYFTEAGLEVELAQMAAPAAIAGLTNKEIQLSSAGSAVRAAYQGAPLRAVFFYYDRNTFLAVGAPEVKTYRTIRDQPDALKAWIRASIRALQLIRDNPGETADIAARELGLDRDVALRAIELQRPAVSADDPGGFTEAGLLLNAEMDLEAMGQAGDPAEFGKRAHDLTLLRQVQREMGIRCTRGYQCQ
jgi:ABC-type nitrate/sulfonate/bicarbonate transport system substrate-binding protein